MGLENNGPHDQGSCAPLHSTLEAVQGVLYIELTLANPLELKETAVPGFGRFQAAQHENAVKVPPCLLYTSPSPRDKRQSRMPSSA